MLSLNFKTTFLKSLKGLILINQTSLIFCSNNYTSKSLNLKSDDKKLSYNEVNPKRLDIDQLSYLNEIHTNYSISILRIQIILR